MQVPFQKIRRPRKEPPVKLKRVSTRALPQMQDAMPVGIELILAHLGSAGVGTSHVVDSSAVRTRGCKNQMVLRAAAPMVDKAPIKEPIPISATDKRALSLSLNGAAASSPLWSAQTGNQRTDTKKKDCHRRHSRRATPLYERKKFGRPSTKI